MLDRELIEDNIKSTLEKEGKAILELSDHISPEFIDSVVHIYGCRGKIVVTGIGKSAMIGQKMVATLNSTGTKAVFLHAAEALHGDLGIIHSDDIIICLSKSGNTPEIKALLPVLKDFGNKIISISSNNESYLAHHSDFFIYSPIHSEADPNNLAPTVSTICQMAICDAMAVAVLKLKGFTSQEFAKLHPGGSLGRQLYLKVNDIVTHNKKPHNKPDDNIRAVILSITSGMLGATAVIDEDGELMGIITDGDIRRMLEHHDDVSNLKASDIMSKNPKTISPDALATDAFEKMKTNKITQLLVWKNQEFLGIIHLHDLIKEGIY
ncbi:MAG TPA: KpsF/GutQ family sugar-phosphate isomerase [Saprospiraceae bacterium]|nr:KpsF/GutQ family sugar-phosphate isomerase [Saprospiraceae bacterium]MCB9329387.1 KpsF/GutQ family sugar-phosphate isomerase [Lewinellaceae bacterium]HPK08824.1 KpsF/GutQ family sugar-phosphate isomerase [Saprospiraceae bacterium]HPQ21339.1 KpsF/GutQ family sugar-phosphate isomerase [Saprospiraceae bacterium]HRX28824.1 KpsF/GutQ family sugar-phosphate isomerase [Saprospiraceae bacterium]